MTRWRWCLLLLSVVVTFPAKTGLAQISADDRLGAERSPSLSQSGEAIGEPQGLYQLPDGQLILSRECQP